MKVKATTADAYKLIHDGVLALARAERQGIRIDTDYCNKKIKHLSRKIEYHHGQLKETKLHQRWNTIYKNKTNIYSNHQLSYVLYKNMKIEPAKRTASGGPSTDEEALSRMDVPGLNIILKIRKLSKIKDTYLGGFIREETNGYIHPVFNLHTVRTYRSSSSDPNFQNIPKRDKEALKICRRALFPRPGRMLIEADFSALEVMISVMYHKDPTMISYLQDDTADMHLDMAKQIFMIDNMNKSIPEHAMLRQAAKVGFVFPQFYGDYYANNAVALAEWAKLPQEGKWKKGQGVEIPSGNLAEHMISQGVKNFNQFLEYMKKVENDFWNNRFKVYNRWRKAWVDKYRKKGYLKMLTGFQCSGIMRNNEIINYPIQGTAFHCLLLTFIKLDEVMRKEGWDSRLVGQIHDSIIMDVHPDEFAHVQETAHRIVREELPKIWDWIIVPLEIEIDAYEVDSPWIN